GHGDQLGVAAGFVGHVENADGAAADHRARHHRVGGDHQHVQGVAVLGQGAGDEAVVGGVEHRGGHEAVDEDGVVFFLDFVLDGIVVGGNLDDDIDVVRQIVAGRDAAVTHSGPSGGVGGYWGAKV